MWPIQLIKNSDPSFPKGLTRVRQPPKQLYYRGHWQTELFNRSIGVVGSRRMTQYGRQVTERFIGYLVTQKITTISGFMYGLDTEVHRQTLAFGGRTIAVLGSGLDVIYPPENTKLYQEILAKDGLIVSEYEANTRPQLWTFPQRNRLVAGLASLGVLLIEAGEKSGSLITARLAREQGKKVYAVPGPVTSSVSRGTNLLIKNRQAKMVLDPEELLKQKTASKETPLVKNLSPEEKKIIALLEAESLTADEIAAQVNQSIIQTNKTLSLMALKALITEAAGKYYLPAG